MYTAAFHFSVDAWMAKCSWSIQTLKHRSKYEWQGSSNLMTNWYGGQHDQHQHYLHQDHLEEELVVDLLATASALLGSGHLPAVLLHRHDHHILIALLSSLIIYWSVSDHILILILCSFFWLATIVTLVLLPQASTPPSSRSKAASCSKSCSACSTLITKTVRLRQLRSRRSWPPWAAFRLLVSFWRFLVF